MNWMTIVLIVLAVKTLLFLLVVYSRPDLVVKFIKMFVKKVPMGHAGIRTRFGAFDSVYRAGLVFTIPIMHEVEVVPCEIIQRIPIIAKVQTREGDWLEWEFSFEYNVDFDCMEKHYYAVKDGMKEFKAKVENTIITLAGIIASTKTLKDLYQKKEALWMALNCRVRLSVMPHADPKKWGIDVEPAESNKIPEFYEKHKPQVISILKDEDAHADDQSDMEGRYGVNAITVDIVETRLSKETQDAINRKKRDEAMARAAKYKADLIRRFQAKDIGLTPEAAKQAAEASLGQLTENRGFSALGLKGIIDVNLGGGK